jgi:alkylation response protein AidB-like acyl-CoA dehydrogenase
LYAAGVTDATDLLAAAHRLAPAITADGARMERASRLTDAVIAGLVEAGFFRMLLPRSIGGSELAFPDYLRVIEVLGQADGSTGWCVNQSCGRSMISAWLEPSAAKVIFGGPHGGMVANGPRPGRAERVADGYRLTGRWDFVSGIHHAAWLVCFATVTDGGQPARRADGSLEIRHLLVPRAAIAIESGWDVAGLRATGSDRFALEDYFVPSAHAVLPDRDGRREPGPLYVAPMIVLFGCGFGAVSLGIARAALDEFIGLAGGKVARGEPTALADQAVAQLRVGQAEADWASGRALLFEAAREVWSAIVETNAITLEQRARLRLAATHAIHLASRAVDTAYHAAGATAIDSGSRLQRCFQDIHVATQHVQARLAHYESVGRVRFGLPPDEQWL